MSWSLGLKRPAASVRRTLGQLNKKLKARGIEKFWDREGYLRCAKCFGYCQGTLGIHRNGAVCHCVKVMLLTLALSSCMSVPAWTLIPPVVMPFIFSEPRTLIVTDIKVVPTPVPTEETK